MIQKYALAKVSGPRLVNDIEITMITYLTKHGAWKVHPSRDEIETFDGIVAITLAQDYACSLIIIDFLK